MLGGLGVGDDVVWQAANPAEIDPFVEAFLATAHGTTPLTYLSFRLPPARVLDRFARYGTASASPSSTAGPAASAYD